jgi:hypothetical protein
VNLREDELLGIQTAAGTVRFSGNITCIKVVEPSIDSHAGDSDIELTPESSQAGFLPVSHE